MGVIAGSAMVLRRVPRVARQHGLNVDGYTLLAAAALVLLLLDPEALFLPGFQLSFTAAWAILFLTPAMAARLRRLPAWLAAGLAGTVAAQLGTFPILVWHYGNAPLAGLAANLLAVPLAGIVLWAGMATCALAALVPPLAFAAGQATAVATRGLVLVSRIVAAWPWACPELAQPSWLALLLWYAALLALGAWLHRRPVPHHRA
jgi:competence protein ComEC